jgi:hypothetical protein
LPEEAAFRAEVAAFLDAHAPATPAVPADESILIALSSRLQDSLPIVRKARDFRHAQNGGG